MKATLAATAMGGVLATSGCIAPQISPSVLEKDSQPWRCEHCGHLTRSGEDISSSRCPRCKRKHKMKKITEAQLQEYLR